MIDGAKLGVLDTKYLGEYITVSPLGGYRVLWKKTLNISEYLTDDIARFCSAADKSTLAKRLIERFGKLPDTLVLHGLIVYKQQYNKYRKRKRYAK